MTTSCDSHMTSMYYHVTVMCTGDQIIRPPLYNSHLPLSQGHIEVSRYRKISPLMLAVILSLSHEEAKIRKSYFKLAQKYHPDKNPDGRVSKTLYRLYKASLKL